MATIISFQGFRYNANKFTDWSKILVPPYDVISTSERKHFLAKNPYNMVHLTLAVPQGEIGSYAHVRQLLASWTDQQVLIQDKESCIYFYTMEFQSNPDYLLNDKSPGSKKVLSGFIALVRLEEFNSGIVIPHEITFPKPKEDRLNLLESCHAHLEPIYGLYEDKAQKIRHALLKIIPLNKPNIEITDANHTIHRFWKVSHPQLMHLVESVMHDKSILIADGHHRYEASLMLRNKLLKKGIPFSPDHPANFIMMYLVNMEDPELVISPTHRLIRNLPNLQTAQLHKRLEKYFTLTHCNSKEELLDKINSGKKESKLFGLYDGKFYLLELKKTPIDISKLLETDIFQDFIIDKTLGIPKQESMHEHIGYTHSLTDVIHKVDSKSYQFGFILRPPDIHDVKRICEQGRRLPQKSTYFYPKPLSGLVLYRFDGK